MFSYRVGVTQGDFERDVSGQAKMKKYRAFFDAAVAGAREALRNEDYERAPRLRPPPPSLETGRREGSSGQEEDAVEDLERGAGLDLLDKDEEETCSIQ